MFGCEFCGLGVGGAGFELFFDVCHFGFGFGDVVLGGFDGFGEFVDLAVVFTFLLVGHLGFGGCGGVLFLWGGCFGGDFRLLRGSFGTFGFEFAEGLEFTVAEEVVYAAEVQFHFAASELVGFGDESVEELAVV